MKTSGAGLDLVKRFEGFSPVVYTCPAGYPTIGYGHVVTAGEAFPDGIDRQKATEILRRDIMVAERAVARLITSRITQPHFDALVSFTFNLGGGALQRSTLRRKLNRGEYDDVPAEFRKWVFAGGRKLPGLIRRRKAEAELFELGSLALNGKIAFTITTEKESFYV